jgi:toxin-antitoxin system PIN domain toxin
MVGSPYQRRRSIRSIRIGTQRFVRVVTHPKIFAKPSSTADALAFAAQVREQPNAALVSPGTRHWDIFPRLCVSHAARGNLVPDAYLAALAIQSGCERVSTDRDFARFKELRTSNPVA